MKRPKGSPPRAVTAVAAAKVNLGWRVGDLREDGFHDVLGLIHTISLTDTVEVRTVDDPDAVSGDVRIELDGVPVGLTVPGVPNLAVADNLVLESARALSAGVLAVPTSITLYKRIPAAAGLGGGSADAAAALLALSFAWAADVRAQTLVKLAGAIGSDVPAILVGGLVHVSGRGETVRNIGCADGTRFVLGISDTELPTPVVYGRLDELRSFGAQPPARGVAHNDLEAAAVSLAPAVGEGLAAMRDAGAETVFVSGSGPTVVGLPADPASADEIARRAAPAFVRTLPVDATCWGVRLMLG